MASYTCRGAVGARGFWRGLRCGRRRRIDTSGGGLAAAAAAGSGVVVVVVAPSVGGWVGAPQGVFPWLPELTLPFSLCSSVCTGGGHYTRRTRRRFIQNYIRAVAVVVTGTQLCCFFYIYTLSNVCDGFGSTLPQRPPPLPPLPALAPS